MIKFSKKIRIWRSVCTKYLLPGMQSFPYSTTDGSAKIFYEVKFQGLYATVWT